MDARPHRPLRNMRTFNDENVLHEGPLPKTIHHRNKSSPALSSMANGTGFKTAAKRTAFGDVSNIKNISRPAKEDLSLPTKPLTQTSSKSTHTIYERKSAAFLRPAQRPLSVSSLRSLLTGSQPSTASVEASREQVLHEQAPLPPSANVRKALTKRNTTIFKDTILDTVQELETSDPQKPLPIEGLEPQTYQSEVPVSDVVDAQHDPQLYLPPPSTSNISIEPVKSSPYLATQDTSQDSVEPHATSLPLSREDRSDLEVKPDLETQPVTFEAPLVDDHDRISGLRPEEEPSFATAVKKIEPQLTLPPLEQVLAAPIMSHSQSNNVQPSARPEPEEYWEDDEEGYEEEGFVTARSYRSRGDNTTGVATAVMAPRMNQQARREIEAAARLVEATRSPEEIEDESFDTSMVAEYGDEIFDYMRRMESKMLPNPHYMDNQHEIQWSMRSVLMDWLVQVHHRFNLLPETLFLCVNYIDRFLSSKVVSLGKLQLVGATAIFIAAKYEEINCPSVQEIVYMVDGGYSVDEILKAERFMLTMLQFELGWPGPMSFLRRISKADDYDLETRTLAKYFLEVTLMDERFIGSPPSFAAAASHCLARMMLRKGSWSAHHVYYSGYTFPQLRPLVQLLLECCEDPVKHHRAVYDKYCDKRYKRASVFVQTEISRGYRLPDSPSIKTFNQSPTYAYYANAPFFGI